VEKGSVLMNADEEVPKRLKYLIVTSHNADEVDSLLTEKISDWGRLSFVHRRKFLEKNFKYRMCSRFTLEKDEEKVAKEDYHATLQYLISEAKDFGIASVMK
jgi:hypothetical protein